LRSVTKTATKSKNAAAADDSNSIDSYAEEQCANSLFLFSQCSAIKNSTCNAFLAI
jgi:hypothetical protein